MRYVAGIYRRLDIYRSDNFSFIEQIKLGRYPVLLRKCGHTCCACYSVAIAQSPGEPPGGGGAEAPAGAGREQRETAAAGSSGDPPRERAKALSY